MDLQSHPELMKPIARFAELGALIERRWREQNYDEGSFPDIAAHALLESRVVDHVEAWDVVRWLHTTPALPAQMDLQADFGNPPITVFVGPRFFIDVYFWLDGTTSIHQHSFSGAFQLLLGSSVHARYCFAKDREINPHFLTGRISLAEVSLLKKGDVRKINAGPEYIHSLFHLDRPSVTITIRTYKAPSWPVQFRYLKPFFARNPFFVDPLLKRKVQTVELLLQMKHPQADEFIAELMDCSDFQTTYSVLDSAFEFFCHRELEELLGVSRSRERFQSLLERTRVRHGELADRLVPTFEEQWRQKDISRRRGNVKDEDHRFLLALLLNVPDRDNILRLITERFPNDDPVDLVGAWIQQLAATQIFGSREPNVLGIGEFGDHHNLVLKGLLRGLSIDALEAEARAANIEAPIQPVVNHVTSLSLFKPLFSESNQGTSASPSL